MDKNSEQYYGAITRSPSHVNSCKASDDSRAPSVPPLPLYGYQSHNASKRPIMPSSTIGYTTSTANATGGYDVHIDNAAIGALMLSNPTKAYRDDQSPERRTPRVFALPNLRQPSITQSLLKRQKALPSPPCCDEVVFINVRAPTTNAGVKLLFCTGSLNLIIPGLGTAIYAWKFNLPKKYFLAAILQLLLLPCGIGLIWSWIHSIAFINAVLRYDCTKQSAADVLPTMPSKMQHRYLTGKKPSVNNMAYRPDIRRIPSSHNISLRSSLQRQSSLYQPTSNYIGGYGPSFLPGDSSLNRTSTLGTDTCNSVNQPFLTDIHINNSDTVEVCPMPPKRNYNMIRQTSGQYYGYRKSPSMISDSRQMSSTSIADISYQPSYIYPSSPQLTGVSGMSPNQPPGTLPPLKPSEKEGLRNVMCSGTPPQHSPHGPPMGPYKQSR